MRPISVKLTTWALAGLWLFSSCGKDKAGLGGEVLLALFPEHHTTSIYGQSNYPDSAMLKFDATDFPGDDYRLYDAVVVGNAGEHFVKVSGLKKGKYFIYMAGWDTTINERVAGGIPYEIFQSDGELTARIPVTEGD